jgi:hypothetical protein
MAVNKPGRLGSGTILLVLIVCSCETLPPNPEPPVHGDYSVGPTEKIKQPWGWEYVFKNNSNQTIRLEKRNPIGALFPGACITTFAYSTNNQVEVERSFDSNEKPCMNENGYAVSRFQYTFDSEGKPAVVEQFFFGSQDQPVMTRQGFARLRRTLNPAGQATEVQFYDLAGRPAPAFWLGVTNVVDVKFVYLTGATEVTGGLFYDAAGNMVARKQVGGLTSTNWSDF